MSDGLRIVHVGEAAVCCQADGAGSLPTQQRIWALDQAARSSLPRVECIVGMGNLTVAFDPFDADADSLSQHLQQLWPGCAPLSAAGPTIEIPVVYGGAGGPDLGLVAEASGLSIQDVVRLHSAPLYTVFFMGFLPGFAYLGQLDPRLATPRPTEPRLNVPAGSVGIGGGQTGIYPVRSPGGWQLIGEARRALFDASRREPALLSAGWRVRFEVDKILPC
jgi:5-oxoprolinase (ATP-hydrolysing) subunit B